MTPRDVAQLLMIGIPADGDLAAVRELQPGGVILMGRNGGTPAQVRRLTQAINEALAVPPLIAVDQEGGRVQRLTDGFMKIPAARDLAACGANHVGITAATVAAELRTAGLNCNFAPVCDVPVHGGDTVIASRAFSDDPLRAALLAAEYIRAAQPTVVCTAKHFPGHGGVGIDSHQALPTYEGTWDELEETHLPPFQAAIAAGVDAVMVGHIAVPCLDATGTPASLSAPMVTGLLREKLGFRGLVVTDDLEMKALPQDDAHVAVRAIAAGCDVLLYCHAADKARAAAQAIADAVNGGELPAARVADAVARVAWVKRKYGIVRE